MTPEQQQEEQEWLAIEAQHTRAANGRLYPIGYGFDGPKVPSKPHPKSYRPDLPLRSNVNRTGNAPKALNAKEKKTLANRPLIFRTKV